MFTATNITILLTVLTMLTLAVLMSWILGWANVAFRVETDPREQKIADILPGANCGACGYAGCSDFAKQLVAGKAELTACTQSNNDTIILISDILGIAASEALPYRAVVHCCANESHREGRREYTGEKTCAGANLVSGIQACTYGCLGLGDCSRACKYDAIHVQNGLASVMYDRCVGCKACARACPRNIISMVPFKKSRMLVVACSNKDAGPDVKAVCKVGCIGCSLCSRRNDSFLMEGNLPAINYDDYPDEASLEVVVEKCPAEALLYVGEPSPEDIEAVKDEPLPNVVQADFKTTVDETNWRG